MFQKNDRKIKKENYYILLGMLGITIILALLITKINFNVQNNRLKTSPLLKVANNYNYQNFDKILTNSEYFLMFSYTNDENVYNLENGIAKLIKENNLENKFNYVDLTKEKDQIAILDEINMKLNVNVVFKENLPVLMYYRDNQLVSVLNSRKDIPFSEGELYKILDIYGLIK